jgi:hypothetical protein
MTARRSQTWQTRDMASTTGLRARVRAELVQEIKQEARRQVARGRSAGIVPSCSGAPARHGLLGDLPVLPEPRPAPYCADSGRLRSDRCCHRGRRRGLRAARSHWALESGCHAVRHWALAHPHEYALVYGSPIPGYHAPQDTIGPASRVTLVLASVVRDAAAAGALGGPFLSSSGPRCSRPRQTPKLERLGTGSASGGARRRDHPRPGGMDAAVRLGEL